MIDEVIMRRRGFLKLLGGVALVWPDASRAQQTGRLPTVGFLGTTTPSAQSAWTSAFIERMRELGWVEGRTVAFEFRWAQGQAERYADIAAEFVRLKVDVIVTAGTAVPALKQATSAIPVVFGLDADPVGRGLVASLARPGGNVTGLSTQGTDTAGKRLALLREAVPSFQRLAILANAAFGGAVEERGEAETAARKSGIAVKALDIRRAEDIATAFQALQRDADALYVCGDALVNANRVSINTFALAARLATIAPNRDFADAGALMSYGPNYSDLFRRAGDYVDRILRGTKPSDIPVEQPTKFDLVINLSTAKALGVDVSPALLARADAVIE
jgi:putative ABC transport system substrate-binding protein